MSGSMGRCSLTAQARNGRTVLTEQYCTAPFKVMRPFQEGSRTTAVLMTASAGILAGDAQSLSFTVEEGADLTVTGQGYTKLFRCPEAPSCQHITATVASGGTLRYLPRPIVPFAGSDFSCEAEVRLCHGSRLIWWDILSCGRVGMGERFQMKRYRSRLRVTLEGTPVFQDYCLLRPEGQDYTSPGFFDGHTHMGLLYLCGFGADSALLDALRAHPFSGRWGATCARQGVTVRALACRGEQLEGWFSELVSQLP